MRSKRKPSEALRKPEETFFGLMCAALRSGIGSVCSSVISVDAVIRLDPSYFDYIRFYTEKPSMIQSSFGLPRSGRIGREQNIKGERGVQYGRCVQYLRGGFRSKSFRFFGGMRYNGSDFNPA